VREVVDLFTIVNSYRIEFKKGVCGESWTILLELGRTLYSAHFIVVKIGQNE
jgi:hypothetical protein